MSWLYKIYDFELLILKCIHFFKQYTVYVSPVIVLRPVQGVFLLRPMSAGIGSSPPATLNRISGYLYM